jgi:hypothetical protein
MSGKLKPLPIWSLKIGQRVRIRKGVKPHGGKLGTITDLEPGGYWVQLDLMGMSRNPHPKLYRRDELNKTKD